MRIYAADDEPLALEYLESAIRTAAPEAEVVTFAKARLLLEAMAKDPCYVVFTDVEMPGMTGIELATALQEIAPHVNIVFVTGFSEYMPQALSLFASGYVLKPVTADAISQQMAHLRFPVVQKKPIQISTFGLFDVTCNGKPVAFRLAKSRELLAYLVDRGGSVVPRKEIFVALWEDDIYSRTIQKALSKAARELEEDLSAAGAEGLFLREKEGYRVDRELFDCDLYDYLSGNTALFHGEYMEQYSWGEDFKAREAFF